MSIVLAVPRRRAGHGAWIQAESALGREGSRHGLDEYLSLKAVCLAVE